MTDRSGTAREGEGGRLHGHRLIRVQHGVFVWQVSYPSCPLQSPAPPPFDLRAPRSIRFFASPGAPLYLRRAPHQPNPYRYHPKGRPTISSGRPTNPAEVLTSVPSRRVMQPPVPCHPHTRREGNKIALIAPSGSRMLLLVLMSLPLETLTAEKSADLTLVSSAAVCTVQ